MNRRNFVKLALAGSALPGLAVAGHHGGKHGKGHGRKMAGGVYYTREHPGRWAKKVGGHMPVVTVEKKGADALVKVSTPHEMKGYEHYIVKHTILDQNFEFLAEKMFNPETEKSPVSEHILSGYSGKIHVLSVCNKHDTWMATAEV